MRPRALLSWAGVFAVVAGVAGGCDRHEESTAQRVPRTFDGTTELFTADDAGTTKESQAIRELVGDLTTPGAIETVHPPVQAVARARKRADLPRKVEVDADGIVEVESGPPVERPRPPPPTDVRRARATADERWQTVPSPRGPHETAIQVTVAVGLASVGVGSAAAMGDGAPGEQAVAIGALGVAVASFSTALVLHLTEPEAAPKPAARTTKVTVAPGPLGLRGTF
jgi:hypothetical protein